MQKEKIIIQGFIWLGIPVTVHKDECDGGKMAGVNCNLESIKKRKHNLSDNGIWRWKWISWQSWLMNWGVLGVLTDFLPVVNACTTCLSVPLNST